MKEATIKTKDLRLLIELLFEADVSSRAQVSVLTSVQNQNPAATFEFAMRVEEAKSSAAQSVELRYRRLRQSLDSGAGISAALSSFVGTD